MKKLINMSRPKYDDGEAYVDVVEAEKRDMVRMIDNTDILRNVQAGTILLDHHRNTANAHHVYSIITLAIYEKLKDAETWEEYCEIASQYLY